MFIGFPVWFDLLCIFFLRSEVKIEMTVLIRLWSLEFVDIQLELNSPRHFSIKCSHSVQVVIYSTSDRWFYVEEKKCTSQD